MNDDPEVFTSTYQAMGLIGRITLAAHFVACALLVLVHGNCIQRFRRSAIGADRKK